MKMESNAELYSTLFPRIVECNNNKNSLNLRQVEITF
jgi:hypothetical protein